MLRAEREGKTLLLDRAVVPAGLHAGLNPISDVDLSFAGMIRGHRSHSVASGDQVDLMRAARLGYNPLVTPSNALTTILLAKLEEQIDRSTHLIALVPPQSLEWRPNGDSFRVCDLLAHLLECLAGFCAVLYTVSPKELAHFDRLRELPVNHCCGVEEALGRIRDYRDCIREGFALMTDDELARRIPTVFVSEGESVLTLFLGNLEHLINHKHQLFSYLKLLGVAVGTPDLYALRGQ